MPYSLCRFDEVFGELVDGLVAVPGNDALIVPDGDLLTDAAKFVHDLPQSVALKHEYESPDVYLEVQHPCWSCNSNSSSANASAGVR